MPEPFRCRRSVDGVYLGVAKTCAGRNELVRDRRRLQRRITIPQKWPHGALVTVRFWRRSDVRGA
jgi:hypothetical protein